MQGGAEAWARVAYASVRRGFISELEPMGTRKRRKHKSHRDRGRITPKGRRSSAKKKPVLVVAALGALAVVGIVLLVLSNRGSSGVSPVEVELPELSASARPGHRAFEANCARCHGTLASGTGKGPPLVHRIYEPSHHGDAAIRRAVRLGVQPHHWRFGSMPKIDISDRKLTATIAYIRELQRANGIR